MKWLQFPHWLKHSGSLATIRGNCGKVLGEKESGHFVPPCFGDPGFFMCKPKGVCGTCNGAKEIENSTSGIAMGGKEMVPCPTCSVVKISSDVIKQSEKLQNNEKLADDLGQIIFRIETNFSYINRRFGFENEVAAQAIFIDIEKLKELKSKLFES